jgi:hypothetical protein
MNATRPIVTFRSEVAAAAPPAAVYAVLADLRRHLVWEGEQSDDKKWKLLSLDAPAVAASTGTAFSSTGVVPMGTFHDRSEVIEAVPSERFTFRTLSTLQRKRRPALESVFEHRYVLRRDREQTVIAYECDVWPQNYVPYWLRAALRPMTRMSVERTVRKGLLRLATMASAERSAAPAVA